jgi:hypothetical protein
MEEAIIAEVLKQYPDDLSQDFEKFKELFNQHGPMCDDESFYQHTGQCWADSIETLFLYSDGLKEITQPRMATTNFDNSLGPNIIHDVFNEEVSEEQSNLYLRAMEEFLKLVQNRFKRHYVMELRRREFVKRIKYNNVVDTNLEQCHADDSIIVEGFKKLLTLHTNGIDACMAELAAYKFAPKPVEPFVETDGKKPWVKFFKGLIEAVVPKPLNNPCSGPVGGNSEQKDRLRKMFSSVFFDNNLLIYNREKDWPELNIGLDELDKVLEIKNIKTNSAGSYIEFKHPEKYFEYIKKYEYINLCAMLGVRILDSSGERVNGHALAFVTCGNTQYIYDDNYGLTPYPYKSLYLITQNRNYFIIYVKARFFNEDGSFKWDCAYYPVIYIPGLVDTVDFFKTEEKDVGIQPIQVLIPISESGKLYSVDIKQEGRGWSISRNHKNLQFGRHGLQHGIFTLYYQDNLKGPRSITKVFSAVANKRQNEVKGLPRPIYYTDDPRTDIVWVYPMAIGIKNMEHIYRHVRPNEAFLHKYPITVKSRTGITLKGRTRKTRKQSYKI